MARQDSKRYAVVFSVTLNLTLLLFLFSRRQLKNSSASKLVISSEKQIQIFIKNDSDEQKTVATQRLVDQDTRLRAPSRRKEREIEQPISTPVKAEIPQKPTTETKTVADSASSTSTTANKAAEEEEARKKAKARAAWKQRVAEGKAKKAAKEAAAKKAAEEATEIPKKLHFVFLSPGFPDAQPPIPEHLAYNMKGWADLHPDYTVTLWNNAMMKKEFPELPKLLENVTAMAWVSDLLRYHVIQKYGGIYMDLDIAPIQSLEYLRANFGPIFSDCEDHHNRRDKPVQSVEKYKVYNKVQLTRETAELGKIHGIMCNTVNNNVIASVPQHITLDCIISNATMKTKIDLQKDVDPPYRLFRTGPKLWTECVFENGNVNILHKSLFHPCNFFERETCNVENYKSSGHVFGMHEWKGSWKNGGKGMRATKSEIVGTRFSKGS